MNRRIQVLRGPHGLIHARTRFDETIVLCELASNGTFQGTLVPLADMFHCEPQPITCIACAASAARVG